MLSSTALSKYDRARVGGKPLAGGGKPLAGVGGKPLAGVGSKPLAVTVRQARELLNLGNTKLYELIRDGTLKTKAIGRRRLIIYDSIVELLSQAAE